MRIMDADEFLINMVNFFGCIPTLTNGQAEMLLTKAISTQEELTLEDVLEYYKNNPTSENIH